MHKNTKKSSGALCNYCVKFQLVITNYLTHDTYVLTRFGLTLQYIGLGLEKHLDSGWFYYNQAGMPLEKYENIYELSIKHLVIQSSLTSSISLG